MLLLIHCKLVDMLYCCGSAKRTDKGVDLVASLCDKYHTSEDELRRVMEKANNLIVGILKQKPCAVSECRKENLAYINTG